MPSHTSVNEALQSECPQLGGLYLGWSGHAVVAKGWIAILGIASVNQEYLDAGVITVDDVVVVRCGL